MMTEQQISSAVDELAALVVEGKWEIAFEKFYHENVEKTDLDGIPVEGKAQNLANGREFVSKISNVRDFSFSGKVVKGNRSFLVWSFDFDVDGQPLKIIEVAIQDWEDGKIIRERFIA
ncbi:SnoaL-like domain-containing protein [Flavobacterium sp.]|uniref:SnoaL-like domain-containing protein n=1 Tax=Flavobacterium sp. TaxID=239 RepID=UPI00286AE43B|nr:SnoaL-like domain-containing protein [Flavobacterium sp.]